MDDSNLVCDDLALWEKQINEGQKNMDAVDKYCRKSGFFSSFVLIDLSFKIYLSILIFYPYSDNDNDSITMTYVQVFIF
jgi:hypothetical protein